MSVFFSRLGKFVVIISLDSFYCSLFPSSLRHLYCVYQLVQLLSRFWLFATTWLQYARLPCPSPNAGACSNSCPSSRWWHPTISPSVDSFSSCLQSFPASGSFQMGLFFASGGLSIGVSASASVFPMNVQNWFPLGLTSLISWLSKLLSVFSNITVQKHQFFGAQLSLWSKFHIHTWLLAKP